MPGRKKRSKRSTRSQRSRDPIARVRAKELLRAAGEALERGEREDGGRLLEQALGEDPSFVEPALALARLRDDEGNDVVADALVEEAVRRGAAALELVPERAGGTHWWRDEATRPYMKSLVARAWRLLDREDISGAAQQFRKVFEQAPEDDPLQAGVFAAECLVRLRDYDAALDLYAQLDEDASVCYGRAQALFATGKRVEGLVSLWLGVLLNAAIAHGLAGEVAFAGLDRSWLVGDPDEAGEVVGRIQDLVDGDVMHVLHGLVADPEFRLELRSWAPLARAYDDAETGAEAHRALAAIEEFLSSDRIEREARALLERLPRLIPPAGGSRLPMV